MTGFEIAGVALAAPAIVERLIQVSLDGYKVFQDAKMAGKGIQKYRYELDVSRVRLEGWIQATKCGGDLWMALGEKSRRYQLVLETLAYIAGVFAQVEQLEKKYGIKPLVNQIQSSEVKTVAEKGLGISGWFKNLHPPRLASKSGRSRSPSPAPKHFRSTSSPIGLSSTNLAPVLNDEKAILKYSRETDLEFDAPGLEECIAQMDERAWEYKHALSTFRKYEWVFTSQAELQLLIEDLNKYITCLETLTSAPFQTNIQIFTPFNEFRVPFKPPFSRLSQFIGREEILDEMEDILHPALAGKDHYRRRVIVLHGMGGIGKSQVALEYAYRKAEQNKYSTIFWIDATDYSTINASGRQILETLISHYATKHSITSSPDFPRIATDLGIPGQIDNTGKLIEGSNKTAWQIVQSWMAREGNSTWCLIADGINGEADAARLLEALPKCGHGHIVITSRVRGPRCDCIIDIPPMDKESGIKLLLDCKKLEDLAEKDREAAESIVEKLGYLPLALSQAVAYMVSRALDFVEYLQRLCEDMSGFIGRSFPQYAEGVFSCWKLSVQALQESNPDTIPLLRLCSFLSPEGVSKELLYRGLGSMHWLHCISLREENVKCVLDLDKSRLDEAIDDLVKYALIKPKASSTSRGEDRSYWIHPLVQLWARESYSDGESIILAREKQHKDQLRKEGARKAICMVGIGLDVDNRGDRKSSEWIFERKNVAHLNLCYNVHIPDVLEEDDIVDEELALALWKLGCRLQYYISDDNNRLAVDLHRKSLRLYERLTPRGSDIEVAMLLVKQSLSIIYIQLHYMDCTIEDVILLIDETLDGQRRLLGELHRDTLVSFSLKASCLHILQVDPDASAALYKQCMRNIQTLPESDPIVSFTMHDFAALYFSQQEYGKALELFERSLDLYCKYRGVNHQDTLIALGSIAALTWELKDYEKAQEYLHRRVKGSEETFGLANSYTLRAIGDLQHIYLDMNQFDNASAETEKLLGGWRILHGEEHPNRDGMLWEIKFRRMRHLSEGSYPSSGPDESNKGAKD
ncbi:hypothetical protein BDD12DRAFT_801463 [Trichophaea hybrida]|nr:hypothetical protein BDD12DRAFT_801463 [Trichophaea hybrida]